MTIPIYETLGILIFIAGVILLLGPAGLLTTLIMIIAIPIIVITFCLGKDSIDTWQYGKEHQITQLQKEMDKIAKKIEDKNYELQKQKKRLEND